MDSKARVTTSAAWTAIEKRGTPPRWNAAGKNVVLACSALKVAYRDQLRAGGVQFVYLKGERDLVLQRLEARHGHFATAAILDGQFRDLEEPADAITVEVNKSPEQIVSEIIEKLSLKGTLPPAASSSRVNPLQ